MRRKLTFENYYPVDADRLFSLVTDLDTLEAVSRPWMQIHHLPSGPVRKGQIIDVAMSFCGVLPVSPYRMRIVVCDPHERRMRSEEDGMGVSRLVHEVTVRETGDGAVLKDHVELDAGWKTPAVTICARLMYRRRHPIRRRLLGLDD